MIGIQITVTGSAAGLQRLNRSLANREQLHSRIAADTLEMTQTAVALNADHKTANRLGATPTNHLEKIASQIESSSSATAATLKIPRASQLAAAFGAYTVVPSKPNGRLPIAVAPEAYGRRPRTFGKLDVVHAEVNGRKGLYLALPQVGVKSDTPPHLLYLLIRKAKIEQDRSLLPFDEMREQAVQTSSDYIVEHANEGGTNS